MPPFRGLLMVVVVGLLTASPVAGQRTFFNPALSLWIAHSDDVGLDGEDVSDTYYRLQAELPLHSEFERATFDLSFAPFLERYETSDALDHEGFRARAMLGLDVSELSSFEVAVRSERVQDRDAMRSFEDPEMFLTPRVERDLEGASIRYSRTVSEVWSWDANALFSEWSFEALDIGPDGDPSVPEGRREVAAELGVYRSRSARTTTGLRYARRRYELEVSGDETLDLVSFLFERELSRIWQLELLVGGFHRSLEERAGESGTTSGPQGTLALIRSSRRTELTARTGSTLTPGGELPGTAELRFFELALDDNALRRGSWHLEGRYVHRVPSRPDMPATDLRTLGASVEREFHRLASLRLDAFYADQTGEAVLDDSYYRVGLAVVFYPLGRTRLGGAEEGGAGAE